MEEGHVIVVMEAEIGVTQLYDNSLRIVTQDCWQSPEARKGQGKILL